MTVVPPEYSLAAFNWTVPAPATVTAGVPLMMPLKIAVPAVAVMLRSPPALRLIVPPKVNCFVSAFCVMFSTVPPPTKALSMVWL